VVSERFAVNLEMWWTHLDPLDRVRAAAEAGFSLAEIWFWRRWDVNRLARVCEAEGVSLTQLGGWDFEPRLIDDLPAFRAGIAEALRVATDLGVSRINLNGPYLRSGERASAVRVRVAEAIASVAELVAGSGATLMVEPMNQRIDHPGYSMPRSEHVIEVCRRVGRDVVGVNWDFYHLQISEGDLTGHVREAIDWVEYVQIADNPGRHEPGTGEIDYGFLLGVVADLGYGGPIGLECSPAESERVALDRIESLGARRRHLGL